MDIRHVYHRFNTTLRSSRRWLHVVASRLVLALIGGAIFVGLLQPPVSAENVAPTSQNNATICNDPILDLRKTPTTPDPSPASISHFSLVDEPTGSSPPDKVSSGSLVDEPGVDAILRKSSISAGLQQGADLQFNFAYAAQCAQAVVDDNAAAMRASSQDQSSNSEQQQSPGKVRLYAALGDSVAAGLGLPQSSDSDPACGVSAQAYPDYIAGSLGLSYMNLACSGATAGDLVTEQHIGGSSRDIDPQLNSAFSYGTPEVITVTAGANDIYWQTYIRKCYAATCGTATDQVVVDGLRSVLSAKIAYALQDIQRQSGGQPPRVVLTGYYQPLSLSCVSQQSNITYDEVEWMNQQLSKLNQTIADVAGLYSFARYAPVDFSGHELCTEQPWVQGLNDAAPIHPTAAGQQAIARAVLPYLTGSE